MITNPSEDSVKRYGRSYRGRGWICWRAVLGLILLFRLNLSAQLNQHFATPTPAAPNNEAIPPPEPVHFSRASGTFADPFLLTLSTPEPDVEIHFTVDGSRPGPTTGVA